VFNMRRHIAVALMIAGVMLGCAKPFAAPGTNEQPARQDYNSGAYLYRVYCATCHGADGRGDGPVADVLRMPPPDLRTIAERHGGSYPHDEVRAVIDGRAPVPGHLRQEMRAWADVLAIVEGPDERGIRARIEALVAHVESMQVRQRSSIPAPANSASHETMSPGIFDPAAHGR
jgi:mono/diheme cytochrome c family protein